MWITILQKSGLAINSLLRRKPVRVFILKQGKKIGQTRLSRYLANRRERMENDSPHSPTATRIPVSYE